MEQFLEFVGNHMLLFTAAVMLFTMILITEVRFRSRGFPDMGPQDAVRVINDGALVLDVRSAEQFAAGHLLGAKNIPAGELVETAGTLEKHQKKPIVVYCQTGMQSGQAAHTLKRAGFEQVVRLKGGLQSWLQEKLPVVKD